MSFACVKQQLNRDPDLCQQGKKEKNETQKNVQSSATRTIQRHHSFFLGLSGSRLFFSHVWHFVKHNGAQDVGRKGRLRLWRDTVGRQPTGNKTHHINYSSRVCERYELKDVSHFFCQCSRRMSGVTMALSKECMFYVHSAYV